MPFSSKKGTGHQGETNAREAALVILKEVEEKEAYLNLVLNRVLSRRSFPPPKDLF